MHNKINGTIRNFEKKNVTASLVQFNGEEVLKVERDLKTITF
jgi:hypothetical protein